MSNTDVLIKLTKLVQELVYTLENSCTEVSENHEHNLFDNVDKKRLSNVLAELDDIESILGDNK